MDNGEKRKVIPMFVVLKKDIFEILIENKDRIKLRYKIYKILPVLLAAIIPGLSLIRNDGLRLFNMLEFISSWLTGSVFLYLLWYVIWYLWESENRKKSIWIFIALALLWSTIFILRLKGILVTLNDLNYEYSLRLPLAGLLFAIIQYVLKAQQNISRLQVEKEQIQTANYKEQLKAIRAQIDPHFLFNSLNTLRSMVHQGHDNSEEFIISLSDFYRQTLKHNDNATIPLYEELEVLKSFLFLMKSRNEEAVNIDINVEENVQDHHIPTLALQGLVENCFKHNSMTSKSPLNIKIKNIQDGFIEISNNIQPKLGMEGDSGLGLKMLKKRYELLKMEKSVIIETSVNEFKVKLKLIKP